ncbi:MAG TPA: hypothetical protein VG734_09320 [Lacunisphaera sp.]|nr:hypothetical protein [Lacunisphaera sp.]
MKSTWELERVRRHTRPLVNERIDRRTAATVLAYSTKSEGALTVKIDQLEREWDIERWLQTNASALALLGVVLGVTRNRRWLGLTGGVLGFLFLHATQGWCPPLPLLRRLGVRTRAEIDRERVALKFLRGDFDHVRLPSGEINLRSLLRATEV